MKICLTILFYLVTVNALSLRPIIGGKEDKDPTKGAWSVIVLYNGEGVCGGSLVDLQYVLTSASCCNAFSDATKFSVQYGEADRAKMLKSDVSDVKANPAYGDSTPHSDVCVLKLKTKIDKETANIVVVKLATAIDIAKPGELYGWGKTKLGQNNDLAEIRSNIGDLVVSTFDKCNDLWSKGGHTLDKTTVCASKADSGFSFGDSGDGLVADGKLIGVASFGVATYSADYPDVYANVVDADMAKFINGIIKP